MTSAAKKKREKFARQFHSAEYVEWSNKQPCVACEWSATSVILTQCAHNPSRGAGGTWENVSPLCPSCHGEQHGWGAETFQQKYGIRFKQTNAQHCRAWERREATC